MKPTKSAVSRRLPCKFKGLDSGQRGNDFCRYSLQQHDATLAGRAAIRHTLSGLPANQVAAGMPSDLWLHLPLATAVSRQRRSAVPS